MKVELYGYVWRQDKTKGYMYTLDKSSPHANSQGKVYMHRYVMGEHIGRPLTSDEVVHHKDHDKTNNDISNLEIMDSSTHSSLHMMELLAKRGKLPLCGKFSIQEERICLYCKKSFLIRREKDKYCSYECSSLGSRRFEITKEELQKLVWEYPTTHIEKLYGVSDKAIEKRCKKLGVDKPPRGYWAKLKYNKL